MVTLQSRIPLLALPLTATDFVPKDRVGDIAITEVIEASHPMAKEWITIIKRKYLLIDNNYCAYLLATLGPRMWFSTITEDKPVLPLTLI